VKRGKRKRPDRVGVEADAEYAEIRREERFRKPKQNLKIASSGESFLVLFQEIDCFFCSENIR
jgi:hypothetical protein